MTKEPLHPDETQRGARDKRGHWRPSDLIDYAPVVAWPPQPRKLAKWVIGGMGWLPWPAACAAVAIFFWIFLTPSMATMETFAVGWIAYLLARNLLLVLALYGFMHFRLYIKKRQGTAFKYNPNWPSGRNPVFIGGRQTTDNMIWTIASGVPIWTAFEVLTLWAFANGIIPYVEFSEAPVYFIALFFAIPIIHELHFYLVHRLIHIPALYRFVHSVHHRNVNPGPWSGLSMHPVEHLLYFSGVFIYWIVPANPVHAIFHLFHAAFMPAIPHSGFHELAIDDKRTVDVGGHHHYLHHKLCECNYDGHGLLPIDKWLGTFHDGSDETEERMNKRLAERAKKQAAKKSKAKTPA